MSVPFYVDIQQADVGKRAHASASKEALRKVARHHLNHNIGKRFAGGAETMPGGLFGFVARDERYTERKEKVTGQDDPLVFTGALKRGLRNMSTVSATQSRAVIRLKAPHPLRTEQWRELTNVPLTESRRYTELGNQFYAEQLSKKKTRRRKRVG